ncbi:MotA/TolQ/ExbB proton channel family protein, partial [Burkholderia sp. BE17]|nr:MotA/TolQ/ExbB proton channel family protein [Burkholderia sp. BE17]
MTKRSLAALAASMLMSVAAVDGFVAPQLAHAQASGAAGTSAQAVAPSATPAPAPAP